MRNIQKRSPVKGSRPSQSKKPWKSLSPKEKELRVRALEVIRMMRNGSCLTAASQQVGIDPRTAKAQLRGYLSKKRGRWKAKLRDRIERGLMLYERGRIGTIIVNDSDVASVIGHYLNNTKKVLETGDLTLLSRYEKLPIIDAEGKKHQLETRIEQIKEIELGREEVEFADIYAY
jgi:hypothetical protein